MKNISNTIVIFRRRVIWKNKQAGEMHFIGRLEEQQEE